MGQLNGRSYAPDVYTIQERQRHELTRRTTPELQCVAHGCPKPFEIGDLCQFHHDLIEAHR